MNTLTPDDRKELDSERSKNKKLYEAVKRLEDNKDYQLVIMEGFLEDGKNAAVSDMRNIEPYVQECCRLTLQSISQFEGYINDIKLNNPDNKSLDDIENSLTS